MSTKAPQVTLSIWLQMTHSCLVSVYPLICVDRPTNTADNKLVLTMHTEKVLSIDAGHRECNDREKGIHPSKVSYTYGKVIQEMF